MIEALSMLALILSSLALVLGLMKRSTAYRESLSAIRQSDAALALLGKNVTGGWLVLGLIDMGIGRGTADIRYTVTGDRSHARASVSASRSAGGDWVLDSVVLTSPGAAASIEVVSD